MKKLDGVSSEAVKKATGRTWEEWIAILDEAGAENWNHKEIVAHLRKHDKLNGWWQQTVTVAYEKAKGRRVVGQTAGTGFQVGVQKTLPVSLDEAWRLLASKNGVERWLGKVSRFTLKEGTRYATTGGIEGEIRVVKPNDRVRITWRRPDMKRPATLQIALGSVAPEKTSIRFHLEHLPSQAFREKMKVHWRSVLDQLLNLVSA